MLDQKEVEPSYVKQNDNRNYSYTKYDEGFRLEYPFIEGFVKTGEKVIDLGCGNGRLLEHLREKKSIQGHGIDSSETGIEMTRSKGFTCEKTSIDKGLPQHKTKSFDLAVCNVTIQMLMYPETLIKEMKRISHRQIISFPNFAFYKARLELLLQGKMPPVGLYGYKWYSTGHIHQLSYRDFTEFCQSQSLEILGFRAVREKEGGWRSLLIKKWPNLFSQTCLFLLKPKD